MYQNPDNGLDEGWISELISGLLEVSSFFERMNESMSGKVEKKKSRELGLCPQTKPSSMPLSERTPLIQDQYENDSSRLATWRNSITNQ